MEHRHTHTVARVALLSCSLLAAGCASVPGERDRRDPFESYNRAVYQFNDAVDRVALRPVAEAYEQLPEPVNRGITNFFSNLNDVTVLVNDLLQLKFQQAVQDAGRIVFNTTFGLLGFVDVASGMGGDFPKHHEDFGQTLGYWGVGPGPYFVLPFLGPSTIRDASGTAVELAYTDPVLYAKPVEAEWALATVRGIDTRADLLRATRVLEQAAFDPYVFLRESYLQRRAALVNDGAPPATSEEDSFDKILEEDAQAEQGRQNGAATPPQR